MKYLVYSLMKSVAVARVRQTVCRAMVAFVRVSGFTMFASAPGGGGIAPGYGIVLAIT